MKLIHIILGVIFSCSLVFAQVEQWEAIRAPGITGISSAYESDFASDGYGNHYVLYVPSLNKTKHYLIDNNGTILDDFEFAADTHLPAITAYQGRQHIIFQNGSNLELHRSIDGGASWSFVGPSLSIQGTLYKVDAYEDLTGVHMVYSSSSGIYYHLRVRDPDVWSIYPSTVYSSGGSSLDAVGITATSAYAHVLHVAGLSSLQFSTSTWSGPQSVPPAGNFSGSLIKDNVNLHAFPWNLLGEAPPHSPYLWHNLKPLSGGNWLTTPNLGILFHSGEGAWRGEAVFAGSRIRLNYSNTLHVYYREYSGSWTSEELVSDGQVFELPEAPTIGANATGVSCIWLDTEPSPTAIKFRRRPIGISGNFTENYSFTGSNYVTGYTYIPSGVTVRLKDNSVTYIADNQRVFVN